MTLTYYPPTVPRFLASCYVSQSDADPSTAEFSRNQDWGIHKNTTSGNVFLAFNDEGVIKKVQLT